MPAPNLTGQTADALRTATFSQWQAIAGEAAIVGTPEYIMLEVLSFLAGLQNGSLQQGLEGGLINYATGNRLDEIGVLFGLTRASNETDASYRDRILLAPAQLTTAGTEEQIKGIVKRVDPTISDVSVNVVTSPNVPVRFITKTGIPSAALIAKVLSTLTDPKVKPVCAVFSVSAPVVVNYTIAASITTYADADIGTIRDRCATALNAYISSVRDRMGRDVVVNQILGVLQGVAGVYKAVVTQPAADLVVQPTEWATAPNTTADSITLSSSVIG